MPKFTRIAFEGATIDGRKISRQQIQEMSDQYDPDKKHGARIWLEHFRSLFADGPFPALGDVLALKTQEVEVDGKKKLGLYAQLKPTEKLVKMNQDRQKVYTSIEINTDYADTGKAYLIGLAVTDSPSSTGTQMLSFSLKEDKFEELNGKTFSEYIEVDFEFLNEDEPKETFTQKITQFFSKKQQNDNARFSDHESSMLLIAEKLEEGETKTTELEQQHKEASDDFSQKLDEMKSELKELRKFKDKVEKHSTNPKVPKAKGGSDEGGSKKKGYF